MGSITVFFQGQLRDSFRNHTRIFCLLDNRVAGLKIWFLCGEPTRCGKQKFYKICPDRTTFVFFPNSQIRKNSELAEEVSLARYVPLGITINLALLKLTSENWSKMAVP